MYCTSGIFGTKQKLKGISDFPLKMIRNVGNACFNPCVHCGKDFMYACLFRQSDDEFISMEKVAQNAVAENLVSPHIVKKLLHTAYGMSKDFGMNGFRVGCLHTRSEELLTVYHCY